jgi:hypothetical protein
VYFDASWVLPRIRVPFVLVTSEPDSGPDRHVAALLKDERVLHLYAKGVTALRGTTDFSQGTTVTTTKKEKKKKKEEKDKQTRLLDGWLATGKFATAGPVDCSSPLTDSCDSRLTP